jgi:hypothetical protein
MKRISLIALVLVSALFFKVNAQEITIDEKLTEVNDKVTGITERLATAESEVSKLSKIKVSGYMQAQYQYFENPSIQPNSYFSLRRARVKFTYEMTDGVKFVLTPEFVPGNLSVKDAYVVLNDRWTKAFTIWAGKFNRPNYEVEYSSSSRELAERSTVIRTLYPGERAIGAKLEYNPLNVPIHLQLAVLNGADGITINNASGTNLNTTENKDFDNYKDIMVRATYNLQLGNFGGLDFGAHGYFGSFKSLAEKTLSSDYKSIKDVKVGDPVKRSWVGGEFQLFADILGGMSLKGEYITGNNAQIGFKPVAYSAAPADGTKLATAAVTGLPNFQNNFAGYYLYFIKNLGKKNQFAFRYDYYDPNTDIQGKNITSADIVKGYSNSDPKMGKKMDFNDLAVTTFGFALHHYFDDNLRISLAYDIVQNEKAGASGLILSKEYTNNDGTKATLDYNKALNQNLLTLRIQAKF